MTLHRITVSLTSPLGTPLVGPTLFGLICQTMCEKEGEAALVDWLGEPERIWRISDAFPTGWLPRPLVTPRPLRPEEFDLVKERKKRPWIHRNTWMKNRASWSDSDLPDESFMNDPACNRRQAHNVVHRHGRGTLETGGLFFVEDDWRFAGPDNDMDLYVESDDRPGRVRDIIEAVGERGYGRDISTGRGRFEVSGIFSDPELIMLPGARRRMSLSRGVLTCATMHDALWRIEPHLGRAGPELTLTGVSPFKRPVLLTRPGCTYTPGGSGVAGRWVSDIHAERPEIGLNGFHLAIPFSEASQ
ncbi:MAG: hypothetical protein OXN16_12790 [Gammaproteobacteria bacterium]|nr:hypothetical protein [Gammaproteobacteria bacterium]